ncbi:MAG TPA: hypothetical protein VGN73_03275, partial [Gemmatimonadaceae bacterium]|nr:hypothetical protein [Gemmatimonadaceae bacterium]
EHFDCHGRVESNVCGAKKPAHATAPQLLLYAIALGKALSQMFEQSIAATDVLGYQGVGRISYVHCEQLCEHKLVEQQERSRRYGSDSLAATLGAGPSGPDL